MKLVVECYSGHTYAQEPRAFAWQGRRHLVQKVERTWRTPEGPHFQVVTDEGDRYELAYNEQADAWSLIHTSHVGQHLCHSSRGRHPPLIVGPNNKPEEDQR